MERGVMDLSRYRLDKARGALDLRHSADYLSRQFSSGDD